MKEIPFNAFEKKLIQGNPRRPLYGQIELTYQCDYRCGHCYCLNQPKDVLCFDFWKDVLDQLKFLGCIEITFTGGDPVLHDDFIEIYRYACKQGFMVTVFTNGYSLTKELINCFRDYPPVNIEITVNSLRRERYEKITGVLGSFNKVFSNMNILKDSELSLVLKCNGMTVNKDEICEIKKYAIDFLGKGRFKYDGFIFPGLNGEKEPLKYRLSSDDIVAIERADVDMLAERRKQFAAVDEWVNPNGLYHCNAWLNSFYINPFGVLQFCHLTKAFSTDLTVEKFKKGFDRFSDVLSVKPKKNSKCLGCELIKDCYRCPARAFLETGDEESVVPYYCELARKRKDFKAELIK